MSEIIYKWVDGPTASAEEWDKLESIMSTRGWASLNRETCRILIAEQDGELVGFEVAQLVPFVGPLWTRPSFRGQGVAQELSHRMVQYLAEVNARGWIVAAESKHAEKICVESGMTKVETPIYVMTYPFGGVDVEG